MAAGRTFAAGLAGLLAAVAVGYWAHSALKKRELAEQVVSLVGDTSAQLREALSLEAVSSLAGTPETVSRLERYSRNTAERLATLEGLDTWRDPPLSDAAHSYLAASRQLLANQVMSHRLRSQFSYSSETLREHMQGAGRRADGWIEEAMRRKTRVDGDYAQYRHAVENYERLLNEYRDLRADAVPRLGAQLVVDDALAAEARARVIEAGRRAAAEMQKARQLAAPR
jgi:hypothetical protein